jgi:hypothetical protein
MSISNQQQFFEDIKRWQQSGLSQKAWCKQNNMAYHVFHYWYRRFRRQQSETEAGVTNSFVQLQVRERLSGTPWCELVLSDGQKLVFHQPVPAAFIRSLLD